MKKMEQKNNIDQSYIDTALNIRSSFLKLNEKVSTYDNKIRELSNTFLKIANELEQYSKTELKKEKDIEKIKKKILEKLDQLEIETKKITDKINPINIEIEKLKNSEIDLFNIIKNNYPTLSDNEIRDEVQHRITLD